MKNPINFFFGLNRLIKRLYIIFFSVVFFFFHSIFFLLYSLVSSFVVLVHVLAINVIQFSF